jgi:hypothetical protein
LGGRPALRKFLEKIKSSGSGLSDASDSESSSSRFRRQNSVANSSYERGGSISSLADNKRLSDDISNASLPGDYVASFGLTNEKLAHELILNPEFEILKDTTSLEYQIKSIAKKAFFDRLRQMNNEGNFDWVSDILVSIRNVKNIIL